MIAIGSMRQTWYFCEARQDCVPLQWAQKVCIPGVIQ